MLDFGTTAFISILFLVDPPGTIPAFMALTGLDGELGSCLTIYQEESRPQPPRVLQ